MRVSGRKSLLLRAVLGLILIISLIVGAGFLGYKRYLAPEHPTPTQWSLEGDVSEALQRNLEADLEANPTRNSSSLHVIAPQLGLDAGFVAGLADPKRGEAMRVDHSLRIASVTKSYVAATAFALQERGVLSLQDTVRERVSPEYIDMLIADGFDVDAITLFHLVSHRSGIADYASHLFYQAQILSYDVFGRGPKWTVESQLAFAMKHEDPLFAPGLQASYSDTGYILLGDAIERATGMSLAQAVRETLDFDALGLKNTWWEVFETPTGPDDRVHQYVGGFDATEVDASIDLFGGGGLVATQRDLAHGMRAIVNGEMFADPQTIELMRTATEPHFGAGLYRMNFNVGLCFGHGGYWGLLVVHCPDDDLTVALTYTQANANGQGRNINEILKGLVARQDAQ
ncbi:serine hydrolase domain-containing protein [Shimia sp.]|uniref:serine hydrolase domain-containing protein n=1 Tax=Shimia sp. TaxID=1954381 RepID=UPI003B8AE714